MTEILFSRRLCRSSHQTRITPFRNVLSTMASVEIDLSSAAGQLAKAFRDARQFKADPKQQRCNKRADPEENAEVHLRAFSTLTALKVKEPRYAQE